MKHWLSGVVVGILVAGSAGATLSEVQEKLRVKCEGGSAEACVNLGTALYESDKAEGARYFRRACDLGRESLCVFYDAKNPRPAKAEVASPAPTGNPAEAELKAWVEKNVPFFLLALFPVGDGESPEHFTMDRCRIPDAKLVQLVLGMVPSHRHEFRFAPGCDAEGVMLLSVKEPYPVDLKLRKFGGVTRIKGSGRTQVLLSEKTEGTQITEIRDGVATDEAGALFARFTMSHQRVLGLDLIDQRVRTRDNLGLVKVTEFRGKPVSFERKFDLEHIDR